LDTVTEMLDTPLRCLSYLELRARAADNLWLSHELITLAFHLTHNLWTGEAKLVIDDEVATDLHAAMAVRREGMSGSRTPEGILTELQGTTIGRIIDDIERATNPSDIDVGMHLLKGHWITLREFSALIDGMAAESARDGKRHDLTLGLSGARSGITVQC